MITLEGIAKTYDLGSSTVTALRGIDLTIDRGVGGAQRARSVGEMEVSYGRWWHSTLPSSTRQ